MSSQRFTPEFKEEAVRQIVDRGYSVAEAKMAKMAKRKMKNGAGFTFPPFQSVGTSARFRCTVGLPLLGGRVARSKAFSI